jgi:hypothetical protein
MLTGMPGLGSSAAASAPAAADAARTQDTTPLLPAVGAAASAGDHELQPLASAAASAAPVAGAVTSPAPTEIPAAAPPSGGIQDRYGANSGSGKTVTGAAIPSAEGTPSTTDLGALAVRNSNVEGPSPLVLVSGALLLLGLALFVLRTASRRLSD